MCEDTGLLIERVRALLGDSPPDAEGTLTDGYARALALETERARLERRLADLTSDLVEDQSAERLSELRSLRQNISCTDEELSRLRAELCLVRDRLRAARIAAAAEAPLT